MGTHKPQETQFFMPPWDCEPSASGPESSWLASECIGHPGDMAASIDAETELLIAIWTLMRSPAQPLRGSSTIMKRTSSRRMGPIIAVRQAQCTDCISAACKAAAKAPQSMGVSMVDVWEMCMAMGQLRMLMEMRMRLNVIPLKVM
jgi:hypothetical protein